VKFLDPRHGMPRYARPLLPAGSRLPRAGQSWRSATAETVAWITNNVARDPSINGAVPPIFDAYAYVMDPWDPGDEADSSMEWSFDRILAGTDIADGAWRGPDGAAHRAASHGWQVQEAFVRQLRRLGDDTWWLGYLETGSADVVFWDAYRVKMYANWDYVIIEAGPEEALGWRLHLPDLIFPSDHVWCVSKMWDDEWTSVGGPTELIEALMADPTVRAQPIEKGQTVPDSR
jgi:hypothetical protein